MLPFLSAKSILSLKKLFRGSLQYRQTKLLKGIIGEVLHLVIDLWLQFRLDLLCGETLLLMMPSIFLAQNLLNLGERRRSGEEVVEKDRSQKSTLLETSLKTDCQCPLRFPERIFSEVSCLLASARSPPFWELERERERDTTWDQTSGRL